MATRNRNLDKRMNYFERQFLRAQDLMDEQDYAQDRRTRVVRLLHTPGVAEGLAVSAGTAGTIAVAAGTAIDNSGRLIVLLTGVTVNLRTDATTANIFISFSEGESDPSTDPGITGNTRIREAPVITQQRTAPAPPEQPPAGGVLLAAVSLNNGQLTVPPAGASNPDNTVRARAGTVLGDDIVARSLRLRSDTVPLNQTPVLSCSAANQLGVSGGSVRLDPQQELLFQDNGQIRCFDDNHRLVFARAANRMELREQGDIAFNAGGSPPPERMRVAASGNVGIGTAAPAALLDLQGAGGQTKGIRLGSTAAQTFVFPGTAAPDAGLLTFGDGSGSKFHIARASDSGATRFVTFLDNGRVGIGDDSPYATLTLNGTLGFDNGATPMFFIFESGTANADRPILSHSPANVGSGLMYRDSADHMIFQQNGTPVMTIDLAQSRVGIGAAPPANPFQIAFTNNTINLPSSAMVIENPAGGQSMIAFTFAGVQKSSVRVDGAGNVVINAATGSLFLNNDFGGPAFLRPPGLLTVVGNLQVQGTLIAPAKSGAVVDQFVNRHGEALEQGDVVVISVNQSSLYYAHEDIPIPEVDIAAAANDTRVCGIVAGVHGEMLEPAKEKKSGGKREKGEDKAPALSRMFMPDELEKIDRTKVAPGQVGHMVTLGAYAHCKVDASFGAIEIGDALTTSPTKGHAQKVVNLANAAGAIIGKALAPLKKGRGIIPVLVTFR
jgi:hypothetical protein